MNSSSKHVKRPTPFKFALITASVALALSPLNFVYADDAEGDEAKTKSSEVERVSVLGTRAAPRSATESPVPIDIIRAEDFTKTGVVDMNDMLQAVVPSFNVNAQPISDAATLVRPANLRGLAPDHTLVLVNGKRRHRSAVITFLGGGLSDGSQGPDISVIPGVAIKSVEVLRDGAAAQYGSDAIAGVMNFTLNNSAQGGVFEVKRGEYFEGDGTNTTYSANVGLPFTDAGFFNISYEFKQADPTDRSIQRTDAAGLIAAGNTNVADPAQVWGSPETKRDFKLFVNNGLDLGNGKEFYMFGNWAERDVEGGFFFRNPHTRSGVFGQFYNNGTPNNPNDDYQRLLIGDMTGNMTGNCGEVRIGSNNRPDPTQLAALNANSNCFAFFQLYPGGFTPRFGGKVTDGSFAIGTKGEWGDSWFYDLSAYAGRSEVEFYINNTLNASLGPQSPRGFKPGAYTEIEKAFNFDISKPLEPKWADSANIAAGFEMREDTFEITAGDVASYEVGPFASQGFGIGSNGFPGFKPQDAGSFSRQNYAFYVDGELSPRDNLHFGAALRFEDYDDFGSTTNWKLTGLWNFTEAWGVRAAASTGFRAPTVGQNNVRNVTTQFTTTGLQDQATLPPTNPISVLKGGKPLEPEESFNLSAGIMFSGENTFITLDFYQIEVTDRLSQTSPLTLTQAEKDALQAQGILDAQSFNSVVYFTNDFDTTTKGMDLVVTTEIESIGLNISWLLNYTDTTVDSFNPANTFPEKVETLEDGLPEWRSTLTLRKEWDAFSMMFRANYYDSYYEDHLNSSLPIYAGKEITFDIEGSYNFNDKFSGSLGVQNFTDEYPDNNPWASIAGAAYPPTSPMGFNGGYYYARLSYNF